MKIINYEKKEIIPLTDKENEPYEKWKLCHICRKEFSTDKNGKNVSKLYHKVSDHYHYTGKFTGIAHSIYNLKYKTTKEILLIFHNGSTYDYHFISNNQQKNLIVNLNAQYQLKKNLIMVKQLCTN